MRSSVRASITGEAMIPHRFLRRSRVQEWPPRGRTTSAGMRAADGDATKDRRWLLVAVPRRRPGAGPFIHTFRPMVEACLRAGTHYLDITGEYPVFESLAARDGEARAAGIMVLPGAGFDVVPSGCLGAHLKRRLPPAPDPAPRA